MSEETEKPIPFTRIFCNNPDCENYRDPDACFTVSVTYTTNVGTNGEGDPSYGDMTSAEADFRCEICEEDAEDGEVESLENLPNVKLFCDTIGCEFRRSPKAKFVKKTTVSVLVDCDGEELSPAKEDEEPYYSCHSCDCRAYINPNYID